MRKVCGLVAGLVAMQGAWAQPYLGFGLASFSLDSDYSPIGDSDCRLVAGCLRR